MSGPNDKRGDELNEYHNQGQSDHNDGKYEPPHHVGFFDGIIYPESTNEQIAEDNAAYDSGYSNARDNK